MEKKQYPPECAAWEKQDKNGNTYLSVKLPDGTWKNLFKNKYKEAGSKSPDWKELKPKPHAAGAVPTFGDEEIPF